jgi:hypothetical protein
VMVDPDELAEESHKSVAGPDGVVKEPGAVLPCPFTLVAEGSALQARADRLLADPYADRAKCDRAVVCPDGDGMDADAMVETGDGTVGDAAGFLPSAAEHHADCLARPAIAAGSVVDPVAVVADPSTALADAGGPGLDVLPLRASRFTTPVAPKAIRRAGSGATAPACDNADGLVVAKTFELGPLSPAASWLSRTPEDISARSYMIFPSITLPVDYERTFDCAEFSRATLAQLMQA